MNERDETKILGRFLNGGPNWKWLCGLLLSIVGVFFYCTYNRMNAADATAAQVKSDLQVHQAAQVERDQNTQAALVRIEAKLDELAKEVRKK